MSKIFPDKKWIPLINIPIMMSYGFAAIPPVTPTNFASWFVTGMIFKYFVFKYRKQWWRKQNFEGFELPLVRTPFFDYKLCDNVISWLLVCGCWNDSNVESNNPSQKECEEKPNNSKNAIPGLLWLEIRNARNVARVGTQTLQNKF